MQLGERPRKVDARPEVHSRFTLHVDDVPVGGVARAPVVWEDLLDASPPDPAAAPPRSCLPGPEIVAGAERVEHVVLLSVDAASGSLELEHRLGVVERVMGGAIAKEREVMTRRTPDWPRPGFPTPSSSMPSRRSGCPSENSSWASRSARSC